MFALEQGHFVTKFVDKSIAKLCPLFTQVCNLKQNTTRVSQLTHLSKRGEKRVGFKVKIEVKVNLYSTLDASFARESFNFERERNHTTFTSLNWVKDESVSLFYFDLPVTRRFWPR